MDLTRISDIKNLLMQYNAKPEKYLGQHFILSKSALHKMIEAAEIKKTDTIVEIGPGLGTLTQELAKTGAKIIAIEKDPLMISILKETLANYKNVKIIRADARRLISEINQMIDFGNQSNQKIVANLPYNIATFLIRSWLGAENPPKLMILMIQKEVAQRICSKPPRLRAYSAEAASAAKAGQGYGGQARNNLLGISVQFYAEPKIIGYVPKINFWPRPKVDSAIIKLVPKKNGENDCYQPIGSKRSFLFFRVVKAGFSQPRKQLSGNLTKKLKIPREKILETFKKLDISEQVRAENLSLKQWLALSKILSGLAQ